MVEYILGNYLIEKGKITKDDFAKILRKQDEVRVRLGLIAVTEGMLTAEQAEEINRLQAVQDMRFGDIAVEKGYLTVDQVSKLLNKQGDGYLMFMQRLVNLEYIEMDEVDGIIEEFKKDNGYSNSEVDAIKSNDAEKIVPLYVSKECGEFTDIIATAVRTLIRLVDRHIYIGQAKLVDGFPPVKMVSQSMVGESGMVACFSEGTGALIKAASVYAGEEFDRVDMDCLDAMGELLNCINGLYASSLSRDGKFLELNPPEYGGVSGRVDDVICQIPIYIGNECMYYTVGKLV